MAARLYPDTQDAATLELLAGVPAGTADRLAALEARRAVEETRENARMAALLPLARWAGKSTHELEEAAFYGPELQTRTLLNQDRDLIRLSNLQSFGWGRLKGVRLLPEEDHACGSTNDPKLVDQLLFAQYLGDCLTAAEYVRLRRLWPEGLGLAWS